MKTDRHELQKTCEHRNPELVKRTEETEELQYSFREFTRLHLYCPRCGMYFCREINFRETRRDVA